MRSNTRKKVILVTSTAPFAWEKHQHSISRCRSNTMGSLEHAVPFSAESRETDRHFTLSGAAASGAHDYLPPSTSPMRPALPRVTPPNKLCGTAENTEAATLGAISHPYLQDMGGYLRSARYCHAFFFHRLSNPSPPVATAFETARFQPTGAEKKYPIPNTFFLLSFHNRKNMLSA